MPNLPRRATAHRPLLALLAPLALAAGLQASPAQAVELYGQAGLPGWGLGMAQPLGPHFGLRVDTVTLGTRRKNQNEDGIDYAATLKTRRTGLFADVFPFAGSFRITAGYTANDYKLELDASGVGKTITVGGNPYTLQQGDGLNVKVEFPRSTPYFGIGWGHQEETGLRFAADIGAAFGKAKLTVTPRGVLDQQAAKADVDRETAELRDGVGKLRWIPQLSMSLGYSF